MKPLFIVITMALLLQSLIARAQVQSEPISDLDTKHLSSDPQWRWGGDPFQKVPGYHVGGGVDEADVSKFTLGGIIFDKDHPLAIVNGRVVSVNAYVGPRQVVEIGKNYVVLENGDSRVELQLPPAKESRAEIKAVSGEGKTP